METTHNIKQSSGRQTLSAHPAAELFPMMSEDELSKLADDIAANGLLEPVIVFHGQVLDGRNRLAACALADVEPTFVEVSDAAVPSPTLYVLSRNLHRRHLTTSQRGAIAADSVPMLQEEAKKRSISNLKNQPLDSNARNCALDNGRVTEAAAKAVDVGRRTVEQALQVKRADPEKFEQIKKGQITANAAAESLGKPEQAVYEPRTDRQKQLAESQKERMVRGLSQVTGLCRGLAEIDIRKAVSVCDEEERNTWVERAKELSTQLRAFAGKLQKGF